MSIEDLTTTAIRKICPACSREFPGSLTTCSHDGNPLSMVPTDPYIGKRLAEKYFVEKLLGTGGMGHVYQAKHELMHRRVAIKIMRAQFVADQVSVKRFNFEAIALGKLEHPHIIATYDHGTTIHGQPYIVMEYLQGRSLADLVKELRGLPVGRVIDVFDQVCDALDYAHKKGVLHRDLKPGNIMLTEKEGVFDYVKVVDFGVAKLMEVNGEEAQSLTQQGEVCGSPVYMSPEQCLGQALDRRADIYSMGIVLYETLTGKLPLIGKNMMETMGKHIHETAIPFQQSRPDLYIPEPLEAVIMKALAKKPEQRQQTMAQLRAELLAADPRPRGDDTSDSNLNLRAKISAVPLPSDDSSKPQSSMLAIVAIVLAIAVLGGSAFVLFGLQKAPAPAPVPVQTTIPPSTTPVEPGGTTAAVTPVVTPVTTPGSAANPSTTGAIPVTSPVSTPAAVVSPPVAPKRTPTSTSRPPRPRPPRAAAKPVYRPRPPAPKPSMDKAAVEARFMGLKDQYSKRR